MTNHLVASGLMRDLVGFAEFIRGIETGIRRAWERAHEGHRRAAILRAYKLRHRWRGGDRRRLEELGVSPIGRARFDRITAARRRDRPVVRPYLSLAAAVRTTLETLVALGDPEHGAAHPPSPAEDDAVLAACGRSGLPGRVCGGTRPWSPRTFHSRRGGGGARVRSRGRLRAEARHGCTPEPARDGRPYLVPGRQRRRVREVDEDGGDARAPVHESGRDRGREC